MGKDEKRAVSGMRDSRFLPHSSHLRSQISSNSRRAGPYQTKSDCCKKKKRGVRGYKIQESHKWGRWCGMSYMWYEPTHDAKLDPPPPYSFSSAESNVAGGLGIAVPVICAPSSFFSPARYVQQLGSRATVDGVPTLLCKTRRHPSLEPSLRPGPSVTGL